MLRPNKMYGFIIKCCVAAIVSVFLHFQKVEPNEIRYQVEELELDQSSIDLGRQPRSKYLNTYNLEFYCNARKEKMEVHIVSGRSAIFQLGDIYDRDGFPKSWAIHKCSAKIITDNGFGLVATIKHIKLRSSRSSRNNWLCLDYLQFSSGQILEKFLLLHDQDKLNARKSEHLCGNKHLDGNNLRKLFDLTTEANSFNAASSEMFFEFYQDKDEEHMPNNSFKVVITSYQHNSETGDLFISSDPNPAWNVPVILAIIVGMGSMLCIISAVIFWATSCFNFERRNPDPVFTNIQLHQFPSGPSLISETPLPPYSVVLLPPNLESLLPPSYESIILPDSIKNSGEISEDELPPKYESLFPENVDTG